MEVEEESLLELEVDELEREEEMEEDSSPCSLSVSV